MDHPPVVPSSLERGKDFWRIGYDWYRGNIITDFYLLFRRDLSRRRGSQSFAETYYARQFSRNSLEKIFRAKEFIYSSRHELRWETNVFQRTWTAEETIKKFHGCSTSIGDDRQRKAANE